MGTFPHFLQQDDLIIIISPSGIVQEDRVKEGIEILENAGFSVELAPGVYLKHFKFAGTHEHRLADLQYALNHPTAKAIYCARGGFGITHLIDQLDWSGFKKHPKWIVGFSDITALLHAAYKRGFASLHSSVAQGLCKLKSDNQQAVIAALTGDITELDLTAESILNKKGESEGVLVGGNLSLVVHQLGSETEIDYNNKILLIEEVGEPLYHIDRMLLQLKRAGKLKNLRGMIVGEFSGMTETKEIFGSSVEEIILAHCKEYGFPIGFGFPVGHGENNWPLIHGASVQLLVSDNFSQLKYSS